jgi:glycosyltransferase involved in cell wall biosynthesis
MKDPKYKIVYCTPALYSAGGVERIVSVKASYFADVLGYDVTVIVTEGNGRDSFFPLSDKVKVVNFELGFEELWKASFFQKVFLYLNKQRKYKKLLSAELMRIRPDFTISMLRREINFLTGIQDGSKKIGELHVNRANYRNFEQNESNVLKKLFAKLWMDSLVGKLKKLDRLVVLTEKSKTSWPELSNVVVIPDPLPFHVEIKSNLRSKRVITIGRYAYQKGYDILLRAWAEIEKKYPDWQLAIYGMGNQNPLRNQMKDLGIDADRCLLNGPVNDVSKEYLNSSLFVLPSRFEGFGLVIIEAMSCGVPVVAFNCPMGPDEIITDGEDGFLVPVGDVCTLVDKLQMLMQDQELRMRFSEKAYRNSDRYRIDKISNQWIQLFTQLTAENEI